MSEEIPKDLRVPDMGKRFNPHKTEPGFYYVAPVVEQLEYWGTNTNNERMIVAAHVIRELAKRLPVSTPFDVYVHCQCAQAYFDSKACQFPNCKCQRSDR